MYKIAGCRALARFVGSEVPIDIMLTLSIKGSLEQFLETFQPVRVVGQTEFTGGNKKESNKTKTKKSVVAQTENKNKKGTQSVSLLCHFYNQECKLVSDEKGDEDAHIKTALALRHPYQHLQ